jgi:hypothetical protein
MKRISIVMGAAVLTNTLASTHPTMYDLASQMGDDGKLQKNVIEILNQPNEILDFMVMMEANGTTGHKAVIRSGIPEPIFRKLYGRVPSAKSTFVQVTDNCGMMEAYPEVDVALANLSSDPARFRLMQERGHIEGFNQKLNRYVFYGNEDTEPEGFTGIAPRYNDQSAENGVNIITDAATPDGADNSSIYLIVSAEDTCCLIYPKGSKAGIQHTDKGQVTSETADGKMEVYRSHIKLDVGLHVADWRYISRGQIDTENLTKNAATGPDLIDIMSQMIEMIPDINKGRAFFATTRTVRGFIRRQIMNKTVNSTLSIEQMTRPNGALIYRPMFDGIPILRCDQLLNTETGI